MKKLINLILAGTILFLAGACQHKIPELKVMTFNIRFDNPADGINAWPNRVPIVETYLVEEMPDIIGVQEALHHQVTDLEKMLPGFTRVGTGRNDGCQSGEYSPIYFNNEIFELIEHGQFWLSETPEVPGSIGPGAVLPRIATWAHLKLKTSGKQIFVFNTHFCHVSDEARWLSAKIMTDRMQQIAGKNALIVTGDFNFDIESETYAKVANLFLKNNNLKNAVATELSFSDSNQGTFNGFGNIENQPFIDFVFASNHFEVISSTIDRLKSGDVFISDHWPVVANLRLKHTK